MVTVLDNLSRGRIDNLKNHLWKGTVRFIEGNILDLEEVEKAIVDSDAVVHLAAVVGVPFSMLNRKKTYEVNVDGTKLLLDQCIANGVKRLILISSCAVYGEPHYTPIDELHSTNPLSPYAESKLEAEGICLESSAGLETVALRLFNVYGSRQTQNGYASVISLFAECLKKGCPLTIYGDGLQTRDFVHVSDVVEAIWLTLNARSVEGIFNIASGKAVKIIELAELMAELIGLEHPRMVFDEPREGDIRRSHGDFSKAREILGYHPRKELRQGLKELLEETANSNRMKGS